MAKIYAQNFPIVFQSTASLAAAGSTSGSLICNGYATLQGLFLTDASTQTGSGLQVQQSADYGVTWDYTSASDAVAASIITACSAEIFGNAVKVTWRNGADAASTPRILFQLRPVS